MLAPVTNWSTPKLILLSIWQGHTLCIKMKSNSWNYFKNKIDNFNFLNLFLTLLYQIKIIFIITWSVLTIYCTIDNLSFYNAIHINSWS